MAGNVSDEPSQFNLDFSTLENADALENFDFDRFLNTSADDALQELLDDDVGLDLGDDIAPSSEAAVEPVNPGARDDRPEGESVEKTAVRVPDSDHAYLVLPPAVQKASSGQFQVKTRKAATDAVAYPHDPIDDLIMMYSTAQKDELMKLRQQFKE